jgi:hypothetical protein
MRKGVMVLVAAALLAGCATNPVVNAPQNGEAAVYVLGAVDNVPLPYLDGAGSSVARREITEGLLQLRPDGTFYMDFCYEMDTPTGSRRGTRAHEGVWSRTAEGMQLEFDTGAQYVATLDRDMLVVEMDGLTYSFVR